MVIPSPPSQKGKSGPIIQNLRGILLAPNQASNSEGQVAIPVAQDALSLTLGRSAFTTHSYYAAYQGIWVAVGNPRWAAGDITA